MAGVVRVANIAVVQSKNWVWAVTALVVWLAMFFVFLLTAVGRP